MSRPKHTPGPWGWFGSPKPGDGGLYLATQHSGRIYVMDFVRHGTQGAQPRFQENHRMVPATELARFAVDRTGQVRGYTAAKADRDIYRYQISGIDHPDAALIAAAPDLLEFVESLENDDGHIPANLWAWREEILKKARGSHEDRSCG